MDEQAQLREHKKQRGFKQGKVGGSVAGLGLGGTPGPPGTSNLSKYANGSKGAFMAACLPKQKLAHKMIDDYTNIP